ncbi:MAG TPA: hypothetical protein PK224_17160 [Nitrospira sp.]|nr:hypothetical protein [Nitrospira sp.]
MSPRNRKLLAATAGLIFVLAGVAVALVGQFVVAAIGDILLATNSIPGWSVPQDRSSFYTLFVLGLCVAAGLSVTALFWSPRPGYSIRLTIYVLLLVALLPISVFNYAHADYLVNRSAQALFNVLLVFGGIVVVAELLLFRSSGRDLIVVQVLAVFTLSLTAVFIPATFSVVWLLNALGVVTATAAESISLPTLSTVSGVFSAAVAYLKFRREIKTEEKSSLIVSG